MVYMMAALDWPSMDGRTTFRNIQWWYTLGNYIKPLEDIYRRRRGRMGEGIPLSQSWRRS